MPATSMRWISFWAILTGFFPIYFLSCSTYRPPVVGASMEIKVENAEEPESSVFVLGVGDEVTINVWRNDNLSRKLRIDPSGMVQFPLVGKIQAAGLSPVQLTDMLSAKLSKYLVNPQVDVNATTLRGQRAYVMGEVKTPGVITLDHQVLLWEAVALSGGFTNDANQQNVLLLRKDQDVVRVSVLNLDIMKQIDKGGLEAAATVQSGMASYLRGNDIVYVPTSSIADFERFMKRLSAIISPILGIEQVLVLTPQAIDALGGRQIGGSIVVSH